MMLSPRDVAFIGCRLLALFFAFQVNEWLPAVTSLVQQVATFVDIEAAPVGSGSLASSFATALRLLLQVGPALVLWFGATWISRRIYPKDEDERVEGYWDRKAVLSVAVAATGFFVLTLSLPGLLGVFWFSPGNLPLSTIFNFDALFAMVFGILCIVGSDSIAQIVVKLRRW